MVCFYHHFLTKQYDTYVYEIATIIPDQTMSTKARMSRHVPHLILCI